MTKDKVKSEDNKKIKDTDLSVNEAVGDADAVNEEKGGAFSSAENVMPEKKDKNKRSAAKNRSGERRPRLAPFVFVGFVVLALLLAADIVSQQNDIEQLKQETETMSNRIEESKQINDEYQALLQADEEDFMVRVAVEQLGYSYPNERRYYIVSKDQ